MSVILALNTSSKEGFIALKTTTQILELKNTEVQRHNAFLLPGIQQLLAEAQLCLSDIDYIACSIGPGSFVGTRLAVSVAQGLAYGLKKPLIPLNHLQILAHAAKRIGHVDEVVVALDAKMQAFYFLDTKQHTHFYRLTEISDALKQELLIYPGKIGDAWPLLGHTQPMPHIECRGLDLIELAEQNLNQAITDPSQLLPIYLNDEGNWKITQKDYSNTQPL